MVEAFDSVALRAFAAAFLRFLAFDPPSTGAGILWASHTMVPGCGPPFAADIGRSRRCIVGGEASDAAFLTY